MTFFYFSILEMTIFNDVSAHFESKYNSCPWTSSFLNENGA